MNFQSSLFREVSLEAIREIFAGVLHEDSISGGPAFGRRDV